MLKYKYFNRDKESLIVMIHGFLGSVETFLPAKERLLSHTDVLLVECPGHGAAFNTNETWSFDAIAASLTHTLTRYRNQYSEIILYGYSMGGRIALFTALHYPELIDKLIIESATPGIEDEQLRIERIQQDEERSIWIETDYSAFIKHWEKLSLFQTYQPLTDEIQTRQREIRMHHKPQGIAKALREYGTGRQPNLWPLLPSFNKPLLLLTGSLDKKFESIAKRMVEVLPDARHMIIEAGHTIHVENLKIFDTIIVSFIKEENHD
ncbi:2-succinyl-6-hydroxy-2,4-cyclohexadiene-1-carboxylate synthase [Macrococcoides goetzii]|uniref:Putative 2-succinyl-6-hydroxy-2,4-cyclohexadiene-1-carboxylate synthase n=1 Tax=Macrococcoides goetzii TaxID=1891097 RepID=A0A2G5NVJ2_9STAP|nr:2-succinyl-6-hydroxy-2,4-cyclohexadiene-1-carboxylate synthase [Macrococcus goetzii]RAI79413.1 2-succinyl-6-hydroxy-2,4-cyclohexadiene-1-carboxylate synthase [Macrococcus goetzii]